MSINQGGNMPRHLELSKAMGMTLHPTGKHKPAYYSMDSTGSYSLKKIKNNSWNYGFWFEIISESPT